MNMARRRTNFWLGFTIGLLAALLIAALAVLLVPKLRPIVGIENAASTAADVTGSSNTATPEDVVISTESENISVTAPAPYARITSPVAVSGEARVFENVVNVRLRDEDGRVLADTFTTADAPDIGQFGPFSISLSFDAPTGTVGTLEVFWQSPRDGSETDTVTIPVRF